MSLALPHPRNNTRTHSTCLCPDCIVFCELNSGISQIVDGDSFMGMFSKNEPVKDVQAAAMAQLMDLSLTAEVLRRKHMSGCVCNTTDQNMKRFLLPLQQRFVLVAIPQFAIQLSWVANQGGLNGQIVFTALFNIIKDFVGARKSYRHLHGTPMKYDADYAEEEAKISTAAAAMKVQKEVVGETMERGGIETGAVAASALTAALSAVGTA